MIRPLVSVHVITYNQADFVRETLRSALEQDYENLQVVVADDGSTDGTAEIILDCARKDPRIVPLVGGPNLGITGNCNRGLKACTGEYVAFLGGDDAYLPGKISKQVAWLETDPQRVFCHHDAEIVDAETGKLHCLWSDLYPLLTGGAEELIREGGVVAPSSFVIRASAIPPDGFNKDIKIASDWIFMVDCLAAPGRKLGFIDGVYSRYRKHARSVTALKSAAIRDDAAMTLRILAEKYPQHRRVIRRRVSDMRFVNGVLHLKQRRFLAGLKDFAASFTASRGLWTAPRFALRGVYRRLYGLPQA